MAKFSVYNSSAGSLAESTNKFLMSLGLFEQIYLLTKAENGYKIIGSGKVGGGLKATYYRSLKF